MSLFDGYKKNNKGLTQPKNDSKNNSVSNNDKEEGYYFENAVELAIYGKLYGGEKKILWLSGNNYWDEYKKGYQFFEQKQYTKAIESYKKCLKLNPIGLSARFELCESYLAIKELQLAQAALLEMKDYLIEDQVIARFYRRLGFIEIEKGNYAVAAACYRYSLKFEKHFSVDQELKYIESRGGVAVLNTDSEKTLSNAGLPVLKKIT